MGFDMTGLAEMKARMAGMREQVTGPIAQKAVRAGGKVIQEAMIERTPENIERNAGSDSLEPGAVKADIKVRFPGQENVLEATATIGPGGKTSHVARWVEYGHRMVSGGQSKLGPDGKLRGPGKAAEKDVPAYPFLRPAFEVSQAPAMDAIAETLGIELKKAGV
jgi:HK97 gp10 family phage protein